MSTVRWGFLTLLVALLPEMWLAKGGQDKQKAPSPTQAVQSSAVLVQPPTSEPVLVAQGKYKVYQQEMGEGIGPFSPAIHDFEESWALWRLHDGSLRVEGYRTYEAPQYEVHKDGFAVLLSSGFRVSRIVEYRKLRWRPDSGPLTCDFSPKALDCNSGARDPQQEIRLHLPMASAYGFLWPISAFSMSNVTRFAHEKLGDEVPVSMLMVDERSAANPVQVCILRGRVQYLGQDEVRIAGKRWHAEKFQLKVALNPGFMIWTSRQGLLLDVTLEDNQNRLTERGMKLVSYEQFADF